jgi:hypothetical protein
MKKVKNSNQTRILLRLKSYSHSLVFICLTNYPSWYLIFSLPFINSVSLSSTLLMLHLNTKVCRSKTVSPPLSLSTSAPCPGSLCSDEVLLVSVGKLPHRLQGKLGLSPPQASRRDTNFWKFCRYGAFKEVISRNCYGTYEFKIFLCSYHC